MRYAVPIEEIEAARRRLAGHVEPSPLFELPAHAFDPPLGFELHLKLENLQPIGSFKLRGAGNAVLGLDGAELAEGLVTASAGNMAQGVAWHAQGLGVPCTVVVPDHAPRAKLDAVERLGARVVRVPFERWWRVLEERGYPGIPGTFVHPVSDPAVIAGNGTLGLELAEELDDIDAVLVPYGGGGLSTGIASALLARSPGTRVYACEVETAAPLAAALAAGEPREVEYRASFVDGIGGRGVLPEMWPAAQALLAGSLVVGLEDVVCALGFLVGVAKVVAEGAGAVPVAAALARPPELAHARRVVAVVSGGNIDAAKLARALRGEVPPVEPPRNR